MRATTEITRRSVLAGGLIALAGCTHSAPKATPRRTVADAGALSEARASEQALLAAYDALLPTVEGDELSRRTAERALHAEHLAALHPPTSPSVTPLTTPADTPLPTVDDVRRLIVESETTFRGLAVGAVSGDNAALFASIAASHAVMSDE